MTNEVYSINARTSPFYKLEKTPYIVQVRYTHMTYVAHMHKHETDEDALNTQKYPQVADLC